MNLAIEVALNDEGYKDIAKRHHVAEGTVKSRIFRGRKMLEKMEL